MVEICKIENAISDIFLPRAAARKQQIVKQLLGSVADDLRKVSLVTMKKIKNVY